MREPASGTALDGSDIGSAHGRRLEAQQARSRKRRSHPAGRDATGTKAVRAGRAESGGASRWTGGLCSQRLFERGYASVKLAVALRQHHGVASQVFVATIRFSEPPVQVVPLIPGVLDHASQFRDLRLEGGGPIVTAGKHGQERDGDRQRKPRADERSMSRRRKGPGPSDHSKHEPALCRTGSRRLRRRFWSDGSGSYSGPPGWTTEDRRTIRRLPDFSRSRRARKVWRRAAEHGSVARLELIAADLK